MYKEYKCISSEEEDRKSESKSEYEEHEIFENVNLRYYSEGFVDHKNKVFDS